MGRASRHLSALALTTLLAACGGSVGGGGVPAIPALGVFIDSPVAGLDYVSGGHSGVTDAHGLFTYEVGHDVTFSVGKIVLGTGPGAPVMTPVSLIPGAKDENNQAVYNIAWLLLALDDDINPGNGILLTDALRESAAGSTVDTVVFNVTPLDFLAANALLVNALTSFTSVGSRDLSSVTGVKAHLRDSIIASMAGTYDATMEGDDTGSMSVTLAKAGGISGSGTFAGVAGGSPFALFGQATSDRMATFTASGGISFEGTVAPNGVLDGTWERTSGETGTFHGSRATG